MSILKIYSDTKSFKAFSENTEMPVSSCYDKEEAMTSKRFCEEYRITFDVSDRDWDDLEGQISDTILFFGKYYAQIQELFSTHSITDANVVFILWSTLDENMVNQNIYIPSELIKLAGELNIGFRMSIYTQNAFDFLNEKENAIRKKMPAANERFHASGGADSSDTEQVTASLALVRALPMPPPA